MKAVVEFASGCAEIDISEAQIGGVSRKQYGAGWVVRVRLAGFYGQKSTVGRHGPGDPQSKGTGVLVCGCREFKEWLLLFEIVNQGDAVGELIG